MIGENLEKITEEELKKNRSLLKGVTNRMRQAIKAGLVWPIPGTEKEGLLVVDHEEEKFVKPVGSGFEVYVADGDGAPPTKVSKVEAAIMYTDEQTREKRILDEIGRNRDED